jgi:hypothetical protein
MDDRRYKIMNESTTGWVLIDDKAQNLTPEEPPYLYWVVVDVIAPNRDLAYYIVSVMYPDYETITIEDVPLQPDEL